MRVPTPQQELWGASQCSHTWRSLGGLREDGQVPVSHLRVSQDTGSWNGLQLVLPAPVGLFSLFCKKSDMEVCGNSPKANTGMTKLH